MLRDARPREATPWRRSAHTAWSGAGATGRPVPHECWTRSLAGPRTYAWRRTRAYDEGGRGGPLLVTQLTDRWGTRTTSAGKAFRAEQALPVP
ncbi:hypothetical protein ABZV34_23125 [Streptomyces sp. NPDC005195]|uniref:hypothetical protein n=1 Tax=Streptomyces sp. NPDC005195 TaxID=3154561 RepID=UPI0033AA2231